MTWSMLGRTQKEGGTREQWEEAKKMLHFSSHMQTLALLHTHTRTHTQYESRRGILWEKEWC